MKKQFFAALCTVFFLNIANAQPSNTQGQVADPKAKTLLDKVKKLYEGYKSLEANFTLSIKFSESGKEEKQSGKIYQQGDKYKVQVSGQEIVSDGSTVWHKADKTVRIMSAKSKSKNEFLSPKDLLRMYSSNEYSYILSGEGTENGKKVSIVTFKPNKRKGDYTQIKVSIDPTTNKVVTMTAYGRDNSQYKMTLGALTPNKSFASSFFTLDVNSLKANGFKIEDLRVD